MLGGDVASLLELLLDLLLRPDERDSVDGGHDLQRGRRQSYDECAGKGQGRGTYSLLDDFPIDLALEQQRLDITQRRLLVDDLVRHGCDSRVDVGRSVSDIEVDLMGSLEISSESGVVLESVAGSILVDRKGAGVLSRDGRAESVGNLDAGRETLPRVLSFEPPSVTLRRQRQSSSATGSEGWTLTSRGLSAES